MSTVTWKDSISYAFFDLNGQYLTNIGWIIQNFKDLLPNHTHIFTRRRMEKFKVQFQPSSFETIFDRNEINSEGTGVNGYARKMKKGSIK